MSRKAELNLKGVHWALLRKYGLHLVVNWSQESPIPWLARFKLKLAQSLDDRRFSVRSFHTPLWPGFSSCIILHCPARRLVVSNATPLHRSKHLSEPVLVLTLSLVESESVLLAGGSVVGAKEETVAETPCGPLSRRTPTTRRLALSRCLPSLNAADAASGHRFTGRAICVHDASL